LSFRPGSWPQVDLSSNPPCGLFSTLLHPSQNVPVLPKLAAALNVSADALLRLTPPKPKKQAAKGRLQLVFESASKLPRRQQEKVAEFVEAFVKQQAGAS